MFVEVETVFGAVPIAVITTHGDIDASNFVELVNEAQQVYNSGVRDVLLDLSDTHFISSSGLVALHSVALLMRGEQPLDPAGGWDTIHAMESDLDAGMQAHVKLLNPQERVRRTLERTGLNQFFETFTDKAAALASYRPEGTQASAA